MLCMAQGNLVPNHSFEDLEACPGSFSDWNTISWLNGNGLSPNNFNSCAAASVNYSANVPVNHVGFQEAHDGEGYVGITCFLLNYPDLREYVQAILTDTLTGGIRYHVGFYCNAADRLQYAISTLGAALTIEAPPMLTGNYPNTLLDANPQVLHRGRFPLTDTANWVLISDTVLAVGGEKYITIGNFHPDSVSDTVRFNPNQPPILNSPTTSAYYYIDDVFVYAIDSVPSGISPPTPQRVELEVWPNPTTDVLNIKITHKFNLVRLLDMSGRCVIAENIATSNYMMRLDGIPSGMYLLEATDKEGRMHVKKVLRK